MVLKVAPPLVVETKHLDQFVEIMERILVKTVQGAGKRASIAMAVVAMFWLTPSGSLAQAQVQLANATVLAPSAASESALPDAPSATREPQSNEFLGGVGTAARTIGEDELHILKAPFKKSAIKWDILFVGATGALIATDERVAHAVPTSRHQTGLDVSDAGAYASAAIAGGIYLIGLSTRDEHAQETGIRTAEATLDSVIFYAAAKAILQRQRPYTGAGEGRFFSGNWSSGSFPSGHAMFTWTIASSVAHQYHSLPMQLLMYGMATAVSTTRVTSGQHFPSDVFVGSTLGYLVGAYVAHKPENGFPIRSQNKIKRVQNAILEHVAIQ